MTKCALTEGIIDAALYMFIQIDMQETVNLQKYGKNFK